MRLRESAPPADALAAGFINSLTLLSAELVGRSYGGGVLKLEPSEAEALLMPPLPATHGKSLDQVDRLIRAGDLTGALTISDQVLLQQQLGVTAAEVALLREALGRLRSRRRTRAKPPAS